MLASLPWALVWRLTFVQPAGGPRACCLILRTIYNRSEPSCLPAQLISRSSSSRNRGAMQPQVLLVVAFLTLLASARANVEPLLLGSTQDYMEQASRAVQVALNTVQKFDMAQQSRDLVDKSLSSLKDYWSTLIDKISWFWDSVPEVEPTPVSMA